ncbi:MAG: universal stress protein [Caldilineaceae bacterium]
MRRRVLIPLDGTEFRSKALSVVCRVFDPENTDVFLLLVEPIDGLASDEARHYHGLAEDMWYYSGGVYHEYTVHEFENLREERAERLQKDAVRLRKAGYHVCTKMRTGDLAASIIEVAQTSKIDIIAMVTRGRTGLSRMLFGSVADQVLRRVEIPVMMIRSPASEQEEAVAGRTAEHA